jgi:putative nucleotidyltransferase with HDIG domain
MSQKEDLLHQAPGPVQELVQKAQQYDAEANRAWAREAYEKALRGLDRESGGELASALIRWIGRTYLDEGDLDSANDCYGAARAVAEGIQSLPAIAYAVNCQATVHHLRGDLDEAARLYEWAGKRATLVEDKKLEAMIHQNLGAIANLRGEWPQALEHYRRSLDLYRALGLATYLGPLRTNIGRLQTDLRMWDQAEQTLAAAHDACVAAGQVSYQILVHVNQARLEAAKGEFVSAREACDAAYELATQSRDDRWIGEIHKQYGVLHREAGKPSLALDHLLRARETALSRSDRILAAETAAELGVLHRHEGHNRETLQYLTEAHRLFRELEASRELASLAGRLKRFEEMFLEIVREWGESIDRKDPYTQGHCTRVADYACRLAEADGLDADYHVWFRMGALLHDVGKVAVPLEILNKNGPLSSEEWIVMKSHATVGAELVADIDFPWDIRPMILHHHERWDGSGYPEGLAGDAIPRAAQILAIADTFDAMTTARPYRDPLPAARALAILEQEAGTEFNEELVSLFCELTREATLSEPSLTTPQELQSA